MLDVTGTTSTTSTTIRMHSQSAIQILYYRVILRCFVWENCCGAIAKYCWEIEWKTNVGDLNIKDTAENHIPRLTLQRKRNVQLLEEETHFCHYK